MGNEAKFHTGLVWEKFGAPSNIFTGGRLKNLGKNSVAK